MARSDESNARIGELLRTRAWEVQESPIDLGYRVDPSWPDLPGNWALGPVAGVAADSENRVYVFQRGQDAPPLLCFDNDGRLLFSWDQPPFGRPHMVTIDTDDTVWLIDDGGHVIYQVSSEGQVLFTLGVPGVRDAPGTGFDQPTDIGFGPQGEMYVSDGYGVNKRVVKFDVQGNVLLEWGTPGEGEGEFALPHALSVGPNGLVYVADRENWRVQVFDPNGVFLTQWRHIGRPSDLILDPDSNFWICDAPNGRVTKVSLHGEALGFFGEPGKGVGELSAAHDIAYCPNGDVIVGQLDGRVQKFTRG